VTPKGRPKDHQPRKGTQKAAKRNPQEHIRKTMKPQGSRGAKQLKRNILLRSFWERFRGQVQIQSAHAHAIQTTTMQFFASCVSDHFLSKRRTYKQNLAKDTRDPTRKRGKPRGQLEANGFQPNKIQGSLHDRPCRFTKMPVDFTRCFKYRKICMTSLIGNCPVFQTICHNPSNASTRAGPI